MNFLQTTQSTTWVLLAYTNWGFARAFRGRGVNFYVSDNLENEHNYSFYRPGRLFKHAHPWITSCQQLLFAIISANLDSRAIILYKVEETCTCAENGQYLNFFPVIGCNEDKNPRIKLPLGSWHWQYKHQVGILAKNTPKVTLFTVK